MFTSFPLIPEFSQIGHAESKECITAKALNIERKKDQAIKNSMMSGGRFFDNPKLLEIDLSIDHCQVKQIFSYDCNNWFQIMVSIHGRTFPWRPLMVVMFMTIVYVLVDAKYEYCIFGNGFDQNFNPVVHSTVGIVLGFLIVYQSSQSSQRWWDSRVAWENIITHSRESMRILCAHCNGKELIKLFGRYVIAFSICAKHYLLNEIFTKANPCPELAQVLSAEDVEMLYLLPSRSRPMACVYGCQRMVELAIQKGLFQRPVARDINPRLVIMSDNLGACERILYTPMPWVYTLHLRIFILLYLCMLPLAFSYHPPVPGSIATTFWVFLLSYAFLGLEDMAVQIQNPFGHSLSDLPVDIFIQIIQDDIEEVVKLKYQQYNSDFTDKLESAVDKSGVRIRKSLENKRIFPYDELRAQNAVEIETEKMESDSISNQNV